MWEVIEFVRTMRRRLRFGELSRSPLRLLQLKLRDQLMECEWVARPADIWDAELRREIREQSESRQALEDALSMRELVFGAFPRVCTAEFRVYRQFQQEYPELVITGRVTRDENCNSKVHSLAMRAKLNGFHFILEEGILKPLAQKEAPACES